MNRLTYWNREYDCWSYRVASGDAAKRLAAYEDTGLTPEEIEHMKERLAVDPSGSDKNDELEEAIGSIEFERDNLKAEDARLHKIVDNIKCVMKGECVDE